VDDYYYSQSTDYSTSPHPHLRMAQFGALASGGLDKVIIV
jgi:hypothetical protein